MPTSTSGVFPLHSSPPLVSIPQIPATSAAQTPNSAQLNQIAGISLGFPSLWFTLERTMGQKVRANTSLFSLNASFLSWITILPLCLVPGKCCLSYFIHFYSDDGENASKEFFKHSFPEPYPEWLWLIGPGWDLGISILKILGRCWFNTQLGTYHSKPHRGHTSAGKTFFLSLGSHNLPLGRKDCVIDLLL